MTKVKIGENSYPASLTGSVKDAKWNDRESITIKLTMNYVDAVAIFVDNITWFVVNETTSTNSNGEEVVNTEEWDYSAYCIVGAITDYRDGTLDVKMGKKTALEIATADLTEAQSVVDVLMGGATV